MYVGRVTCIVCEVLLSLHLVCPTVELCKLLSCGLPVICKIVQRQIPVNSLYVTNKEFLIPIDPVQEKKEKNVYLEHFKKLHMYNKVAFQWYQV